MNESNIHIYTDNEAANRLSNQQETLQSLALCLPRTRERVQQLLQNGLEDAEQIVSLEKANKIQGKFDQGNGVIAAVDEKIVAMANFDLVGTWNRRPVFEICDVVTDPQHRGMRLSSVVRERCMQEILKKTPSAYWLGCTKDEKIIGTYERWKSTGACEEIGGDDYEDIKNQGCGESPMAEDKRTEARNWYIGCRIFLVDLQRLAKDRVK